MKHGYIKVAAATPQIRVADCAYNAQAIIADINRAETLKVKVLVFPELSITGYTAGDLFYQEALQNAALVALKEIQKATEKKKMLVFVGLPLLFKGRIFNTAAALCDGKILGIVPKTYLPNYNEFYEKRHFAGAGCETLTISVNGEECAFGTDLLFAASDNPKLLVAAEICEDLWVTSPPSVRHCEAGATIIVNLSASNELVGKASYRKRLVEGQSARLVCGYVYASAGSGESSTDLVFGGHNIVAENGTILAQTSLFENGLAVSEIDLA
ncbi:MAG: nitrilase-related carbon-nitrogen hydrolase, partial [Clostridia bacterium]